MRSEVEEGLEATGILPGGLGVQRKAKYLYERQHAQEIPQVRELQLVCAYAFAAAEQNAANGTIVTAPTCGAAACCPRSLAYLQGKYHYSDLRMALYRARRGGHHRQSDPAQRVHLRRRMRLSGGGRLGMFHGGRRHV